MYIVTEGVFDATLLQLLFRAVGRTDIPVVPGRGRSSAASLARTLLSVKRVPVTLVMDADTTDMAAANEQHRIFLDMIKPAAAGLPAKVYLILPEIEALFFADRSWFERALGERVRDDQWVAARYRPREFLHHFLSSRAYQGTRESFVSHLDQEEVRELAEHSVIASLLRFADDAGHLQGDGAVLAPSAT